MSAEENKALIRRFLTEIDQGNIDIIDEVFAPDCVWHMPRAVSAIPLNREEYKAFAGGVTGSLTEMVHDVDDLIADGDKIVCRTTIHAKHTGEFQGAAPTGDSVTWGAIGIHRIREGQVAEMWVEIDMLGLMQQLGAVPEAAAAS